MAVLTLLWPFQPDVLVRRRVRIRGDQGEGRLLHLGSHAANEPILPDRSKYDAITQDLLDLMQHLLTLLPVELLGLALEEILDLRQDAIRVAPFFRREALDASGRVAAGALRAHHDPAQLLLAPGGQEGGALHRAHAGADTDGAEVTGDRLRHREIRRVGREIARVEAVRVARLDQELLGALGIVRRRLDRQRELHVARDDVPGDAGEAELLGLVQGLPIDREARGQTHAPVVPRRLRVPLLGEVEEDDGVGPDGAELEPRRPLDVLRHRTGQEVDDFSFTALERGGSRGLVRDALEDEALHAGRLAPVAVEGLDDDLDARRGADELVRPGADRRF